MKWDILTFILIDSKQGFKTKNTHTEMRASFRLFQSDHVISLAFAQINLRFLTKGALCINR